MNKSPFFEDTIHVVCHAKAPIALANEIFIHYFQKQISINEEFSSLYFANSMIPFVYLIK